jgi:hypothetical protein
MNPYLLVPILFINGNCEVDRMCIILGVQLLAFQIGLREQS